MSRHDPLVRFGIAMDQTLLERIDQVVSTKGFSSRSDFIRQVTRAAVTDAESELHDHPMVGTLTLVYRHDSVNLGHAITSTQHDHASHVIASLHVHLSADDCLEILILKGEAAQIQSLADNIRSIRGVRQAELALVAHCPDAGQEEGWEE